MEPLIAFLVVLFVTAIVVAAYVLLQYNGLIGLRNHIHNAWTNIDTELKRRYDLIPNLVATVRGYAEHEQEVLESVTNLRNRALQVTGEAAEHEASERDLARALQQLLAVVENYPDLKADRHFLELQRELVITEDRIQAARRFYNGNVRDYRNKCELFPSSIVARMFGFEPYHYFNVEPGVREVPNVEFPSQMHLLHQHAVRETVERP